MSRRSIEPIVPRLLQKLYEFPIEINRDFGQITLHASTTHTPFLTPDNPPDPRLVRRTREAPGRGQAVERRGPHLSRTGAAGGTADGGVSYLPVTSRRTRRVFIP